MRFYGKISKQTDADKDASKWTKRIFTDCDIVTCFRHQWLICWSASLHNQSYMKSTSRERMFIPSLVTIPVDLVYRIFDYLDEVALLCSVRDVCRRMNRIVDSYSPYQVIFVLETRMYSYQSSNDLLACACEEVRWSMKENVLFLWHWIDLHCTRRYSIQSILKTKELEMTKRNVWLKYYEKRM